VTRVLLVTSRRTRRWVVPKGNPMPGRAPHEAAAEEAWEEAGVRGIPCPTPLGSFRYLKRRRLAQVEATVALFPFSVIEQLDDWPERKQRNVRWFALDEAARVVSDTELSHLIAGFRPPAAPSPLASRVLPAIRTGMGRRFAMLGWFQSLMPKQGRFFEQFEAHAATLVAGADALARLLHGSGEGGTAAQIAEIVRREHEADDITRDVLQDVRRVFVTPFDRSAIIALVGVMDDAIDQMNGTAGSIQLYEVTRFEAGMRDMSGIIVEAARLTAEAVPLLRSVGTNAQRLHELTARIIQIEGHADDIHDAGLRTLFKANETNPMAFIIGREIYSHLERVVDRFEDVANEIQGLVIDHA
jgi:predicted phosphate transport protein (TIGR00153 family)